MTRAATWSNSDGLVVGYGRNLPEREAQGMVKTEGYTRELVLDFTFQSTSTAKLTIPAKSVVKAVRLEVGTAWVGGTSLKIGDATDDDGYFTTTQLATANLTAGSKHRAGGAYATGGTDTTAKALEKVFASATDLVIAVAGTYTAGTARLVVELA